MPYHISVLLKEAVDALAIRDNGVYLDATFGGGGHTRAILESNPTCRVIAFDWDRDAIELNGPKLAEEFGDRLTLIWGNFAHCYRLLRKHKIKQVDGVLADFGTSHHQIKNEDGFSFSIDSPLDMRMSKSHHYFSAQHVVNKFSAKELAQIFFKYGEERHSRRIADAICARREDTPFKTTKQLASLIIELVPAHAGRRIHPATRVFQAIRIFVNKELDNIELFLKNILSFITPGGHLTCISFHSLEDRLVKSFIRDNELLLQPVTRKPIIPTEEEIAVNPPSRSAKLRIAAKKG